MKRNIPRSALALCLAAMLLALGCEANQIRKQDVGMVAGGVAGGVLGSQFGDGAGKTWATIGGAMIGALVGSYVGKYMDDQDRVEVSRTLEYYPANQPREWRNPNTGYQYNVTPSRTWEAQPGQWRREFTTTAWIDGRPETIRGVAVRQPNGEWRVDSTQ